MTFGTHELEMTFGMSFCADAMDLGVKKGYGDKSKVASHQLGAYKRVEALQFFQVFKTILIVSLRRDEPLTWLIFYLFGNLSDKYWRQFY